MDFQNIVQFIKLILMVSRVGSKLLMFTLPFRLFSENVPSLLNSLACSKPFRKLGQYIVGPTSLPKPLTCEEQPRQLDRPRPKLCLVYLCKISTSHSTGWARPKPASMSLLGNVWFWISCVVMALCYQPLVLSRVYLTCYQGLVTCGRFTSCY